MVRLSTTAFGEASTCLKRYQYHQVENLVPIPSNIRRSMRRGSWVHRCIEELRKGGDWQAPLPGMIEWVVAHGIEQEEADSLEEEVREIMLGYVAYWQRQGDVLTPITNEDRRIVSINSGGEVHELQATLDNISADKRGDLWIVETKTTSDIPPSNWRMADPQTAIQYITAKLSGVPVVGILFDYLLTKPPAIPRVLQKKPGFYASTGVTTSRAFSKALPALVQNLRAIGKMDDEQVREFVFAERARLVNDGLYYQRFYVQRPEDVLDQNIKDIHAVLRRIKDAEVHGHYQRSLHVTSCRRFCNYASLCLEEYFTGREATDLRESDYMIETDDSRNEGRYELSNDEPSEW